MCIRDRLRTFYYKFLHRRIATNDFLKKINLKQSDKCCFCQREMETISHLFLRCLATIACWNDVKQFLIQKGLKSTALTDLHLMGLSKFAPSTAIDLVLLIGRHHKYSSKLAGMSPSMTLFKGKLNVVIEMEKQEALRCNSFKIFSNKWKFFLIKICCLHWLPFSYS